VAYRVRRQCPRTDVSTYREKDCHESSNRSKEELVPGDLAKFVLGAHPIIEHFIGKLRIREIIGTYVRTDKRMKLDDGKTLALLIHNILTTPNPLYEMEDWLKPLDAEKVGLQPDETALIQDDRIGRALVRFYNSRHKDVFFRLALRAIKVFDLDCGRIHHDTTSVTFVGKYAGWSAQEQLALGNNKDHRPDLKQLVLSLNVTADQVQEIDVELLLGQQRWQIEGEWFPYEVHADEFVFVIDDDGSIFVSTANLPGELREKASRMIRQIADALYD
jgi:hypothetical protein